MPTDVGEAYVRLRPNLSTFRAETETGVKTALTSVGRTIAATVGVLGVTATIKKVVSAAADQEAALVAVRNAVKATGAQWEVYGRTVDAILKSQAVASGFTVEELARTFTRIESATKNTAESLKILSAAQDVARGRQSDLASTALILTRATLGSTSSLRRLGIVIPPVTAAQDKLTQSHARLIEVGAKFTAAQTTQYKAALATAKAVDAQASRTNVLAEVQKRFGGQSAAFANTAAGQFARFQRAVNELEVAIGKALLPTLVGAVEALRRWVTALSESQTVQRAVSDTAHAISSALATIRDVAESLQPVLQPVFNTLQAIAKFAGAGGILAFVVGWKAVAPAIALAHAAQEKFAVTLAAARGEQQQMTASNASGISTTLDATKAIVAESAAMQDLTAESAVATRSLTALSDAQLRLATTSAAASDAAVAAQVAARPLTIGAGFAAGAAGATDLANSLQVASDTARTSVTSLAATANVYGELGIAADAAGNLVQRTGTAVGQASDQAGLLSTQTLQSASDYGRLADAADSAGNLVNKASLAVKGHTAASTADAAAQVTLGDAHLRDTAAATSHATAVSRDTAALRLNTLATRTATITALGSPTTAAGERRAGAFGGAPIVVPISTARTIEGVSAELEKTSAAALRATDSVGLLTRGLVGAGAALAVLGRIGATTGRGLVALVGGLPVLIAGSVALTTFGIYKIVTAESEFEKQTNRTRDALSRLGASLVTARGLSDGLAQAQSQIHSDRIAVDSSRLAVEQARANLAQSQARIGSLAYREAVNQLQQAQDAYRVVLVEVSNEEKAITTDRAARVAAQQQALKEQGFSVQALSDLLVRAQINEGSAFHRFGTRFENLGFVKFLSFGTSVGPEQFRSAADALSHFSDALAKTIDGIRQQNPLLAQQIAEFNEFTVLLGRVPTRREFRILVDTHSARNQLALLLQQFQEGAFGSENFVAKLEQLRIATRTTDPGLAARVKLLQAFVRLTGQFPRRVVTEVLLHSNFPQALKLILGELANMPKLAARLGFSTGAAFTQAFVQALKAIGLGPSIGQTLISGGPGSNTDALIRDATNAVNNQKQTVKQAKDAVVGAHELVLQGQQTLRDSLQALADAQQNIADTIRSGQQSILSSIIGAQQNLRSISGSLADAIDAYLDAGKKTTTAVKLTAEEQRELTDLKRRIAAGETGPGIQRASTRLQSQIEARTTAAQESSQFQQTAIDKQKTAARRQITDLAALYETGQISFQKFRSGVQKVLTDQGVTFQAIRRREGIAAALDFRGIVQGLIRQAQAIRVTPGGRQGQGLIPNVVQPLQAIAAANRANEQAQRQRDDARLAVQKSIKDLAKLTSDEATKQTTYQTELTKLDKLQGILDDAKQTKLNTKQTNALLTTEHQTSKAILTAITTPKITPVRGIVPSPAARPGAIPGAGGELTAPDVQDKQLSTQQKIEQHTRDTANLLRRLPGIGITPSPAGNPSGHQAGGPIYGPPGTDRVPALLTAGEIVINAQQQRRLRGMLGLGHGSPESLFGTIAGFQHGGVVASPVQGTIPGAGGELRGRTGPPWHSEGPPFYRDAYQFFRPFSTGGPYRTRLSPTGESEFRRWAETYGVPFNPNARITDYDMRGFWRATGGRPWHGGDFPDTFKTPYDTAFSQQSRYATPTNPFAWDGNTLVDSRNGKVVFSRRKFSVGGVLGGISHSLGDFFKKLPGEERQSAGRFVGELRADIRNLSRLFDPGRHYTTIDGRRVPLSIGVVPFGPGAEGRLGRVTEGRQISGEGLSTKKFNRLQERLNKDITRAGFQPIEGQMARAAVADLADPGWQAIVQRGGRGRLRGVASYKIEGNKLIVGTVGSREGASHALLEDIARIAQSRKLGITFRAPHLAKSGLGHEVSGDDPFSSLLSLIHDVSPEATQRGGHAGGIPFPGRGLKPLSASELSVLEMQRSIRKDPFVVERKLPGESRWVALTGHERLNDAEAALSEFRYDVPDAVYRLIAKPTPGSVPGARVNVGYTRAHQRFTSPARRKRKQHGGVARLNEGGVAGMLQRFQQGGVAAARFPGLPRREKQLRIIRGLQAGRLSYEQANAAWRYWQLGPGVAGFQPHAVPREHPGTFLGAIDSLIGNPYIGFGVRPSQILHWSRIARDKSDPRRYDALAQLGAIFGGGGGHGEIGPRGESHIEDFTGGGGRFIPEAAAGIVKRVREGTEAGPPRQVQATLSQLGTGDEFTLSRATGRSMSSIKHEVLRQDPEGKRTFVRRWDGPEFTLPQGIKVTRLEAGPRGAPGPKAFRIRGETPGGEFARTQGGVRLPRGPGREDIRRAIGAGGFPGPLPPGARERAIRDVLPLIGRGGFRFPQEEMTRFVIRNFPHLEPYLHSPSARQEIKKLITNSGMQDFMRHIGVSKPGARRERAAAWVDDLVRIAYDHRRAVEHGERRLPPLPRGAESLQGEVTDYLDFFRLARQRPGHRLPPLGPPVPRALTDAALNAELRKRWPLLLKESDIHAEQREGGAPGLPGHTTGPVDRRIGDYIRAEFPSAFRHDQPEAYYWGKSEAERRAILLRLIEGKFQGGGVATAFKNLPKQEQRRRILSGFKAGRLSQQQYEDAFRFWHLGPTPLGHRRGLLGRVASGVGRFLTGQAREQGRSLGRFGGELHSDIRNVARLFDPGTRYTTEGGRRRRISAGVVPFGPSRVPLAERQAVAAKALQVLHGSEALAKPVAETLEKISRVIRLPSKPLAGVKGIHLGTDPNTQGGVPPLEMAGALTAGPIEIRSIGRRAGQLSASEFQAVLAHEFGHVLDLTVLKPTRGLPGTESGGAMHPAMLDLLTALQHSTTTRNVQTAQNLYRFTSRGGLPPPFAGFDLYSFYEYLGSPHETFARTFAQYIATKTKDPMLLRGLRDKGDIPTPLMQWQAREFGPISDAMDRLFGYHGMLRGSSRPRRAPYTHLPPPSFREPQIPIERRFASGGIVPGTGNTDSVPALLTPGEAVLSRRDLERVGAAAVSEVTPIRPRKTDAVDATARLAQYQRKQQIDEQRRQTRLLQEITANQRTALQPPTSRPTTTPVKLSVPTIRISETVAQVQL